MKLTEGAFNVIKLARDVTGRAGTELPASMG